MSNKLISVLFFFTLSTSFYGQSLLDIDFFHKSDKFLSSHVQSGKVDYTKASQSQLLNELITNIEKVDLTNASDKEKIAFYVNAYNLSLIHI